jgi:putative glutamine amidotransferase
MVDVRRPLIGVTGPDHGLPLAWWFTRWSVARAGGDPVRLNAANPDPPRALDGIIIGGGTDLDPALYSGMDDGKAPRDSRRDAFEKRMIEAALERRIPLLGICRGAQLLNVVLGGNLHQDVRPMRQRTSNRRTPLPRKTAMVERGSRLHAMLSATRCRVNSLHHQAVDRLGDGLRAVAHDLDNLVQGIERAGDTMVIGLQWHPEYLVYQRRQRAIFKHLVAAARGDAVAHVSVR